MEEFTDPALLSWLLLLLLLLLARNRDGRNWRDLWESPYSGGHHAVAHHAGHVGDTVVDVGHGAIHTQHIGQVVLVDAQHSLQGGHGVHGSVWSFW